VASYIHGTAPSEQDRLKALNRLTNQAFVEFLRVPHGARVLEVGSGLGILAADVAAIDDGIEVVGVEASTAQIAAAVRHPRLRYLQGDAHHLEFPDGTFDLVYGRYILEHVADPLQVIREMRRVVAPRGQLGLCENDTSLMRVDPPCPTWERVWRTFEQFQASLGGDARIGRRLFRLLREAGFSRIELSMQPDVHWQGSPGFAAWVQNIIGNVESAREGLVAAGLCRTEDLDEAVAELQGVIEHPDGSSQFVWNRAFAVREA
jgi:ubiquinone/menaquinone biosynthesis C-methylase UbiE